MNWEDFFKEYGASYVNGAITVDELYQQIRSRLLTELRVPFDGDGVPRGHLEVGKHYREPR